MESEVMKCQRCQRGLTNPVSIACGYGAVCAAKVGVIRMSKDHNEKEKAIKPQKRQHDPSTLSYTYAKRLRKKRSAEKLPASYKNKKRRNRMRLTAEESNLDAYLREAPP